MIFSLIAGALGAVFAFGATAVLGLGLPPAVFSAAIFFWLLFAFVHLCFEQSDARPITEGGQRLIAFTPTGLAMLGILGTFVGILIGLWKFDAGNIAGSVPHLLGGLKFAFTTSVVGLGAALLFRILVPIFGPLTEPEPEAHDVHRTLEAIRDAVSSTDKRLADVREGQAEMVREFRDFRGGVTEEGSKAIVEALEQVVRDFNHNLTEQFGENFRQLNEAVGRLVEWQDRYRVHVEAMEARATAAVEAIEAVRDAVAGIARSCEAVPQAFGRLEPVLAGFAARTDELEGHLQALAALRERVGEALPTIEAGLQGIVERAAEGVQAATESARKALEEAEQARERARVAETEAAKQINDHIAAINAGMERAQEQARAAEAETAKRIDGHIAAISAGMERAQEQARAAEAEAAKRIDGHIAAISTGMERAQEQARAAEAETAKRINGHIAQLDAGMKMALERAEAAEAEAARRINDRIAQLDAGMEKAQERANEAEAETARRINDRISELDAGMERELYRALQSMGEKLASITEKIAGDFQSLREALKESLRDAVRDTPADGGDAGRPS